jgi:hypothetical protein
VRRRSVTKPWIMHILQEDGSISLGGSYYHLLVGSQDGLLSIGFPREDVRNK